MRSESILSTMTTAFSGPDAAFEWKLLHRFWESLAQTGAPVSLDTLAQSLACERSQIVQVLDEQYPEAEYDPSGNLVGVGLTLRPTTHQIVFENQPFYTWCAPDAFTIPVVLGRPAQIISQCPVTGTRIEVAAPWVSQHADFSVFPLEEAFEDLRKFTQQQMALASRA